MTSPPSVRIGGLCFGYGGLDLAVQAVIPGAELAWYAEFDKGAAKIGAHHWPDVPNYGDMTKIDWAAVEPVDIITGGTPCQDLSHAGKRAGMTEGTRSNLWVAMREAIDTIRPSLVIWENVGGAASAAADSEVEPCAGCVGDGSGVHLRALGRVVGDLSSLGYVGQVRSLRAADVGAPHGRLRYFLAAEPAADAGRLAGEVSARRGLAAVQIPASDGDPGRTGLTLLPTPRAGDGEKGGPNQRGSSGDLMLPSAVTHLLPTPEASRNGNTPENHLSRKPGRTRVTNLEVLASGGLLPTPSVADSEGQISGQYREQMAEALARWGDYAAAIARWESVLGRPAPSATQTGGKGNPQLAPAFVEWMMGLPAGWVTGVPGITRNEALKALGNGVVPQQATAALREMLACSLDFGEASA